MIKDIQEKILQLKKEKDICILAHCYQNPEILEVADFTGDSYALAVKAAQVTAGTVIMCGVRFMAETVKILSPDKKVILSHPDAGCPMAEQLDKDLVIQAKAQLPDYTVVAYVNTTTDLKTVCDVCVTSSSAVTICKNIENDKILFLPDPQLGNWTASQIPEKTFKILGAGCPTHCQMTKKDVEKAKAAHPNALLLVHRHGKQYHDTSADGVSGQEVLSAVKRVYLPEYETDNTGGCAGLLQRYRRRGNCAGTGDGRAGKKMY